MATGVWRVAVAEDKGPHTVAEQNCLFFCGCVPNCIGKAHKMGRWESRACGRDYAYTGRHGGKLVFLNIVSEAEMKHMATNGLLTITRD